MGSAGGLQTSLWRGCPIGNLRAHGLHAAPPERFAGLRVLHRPSAPRHPPGSLSSLSSRLSFSPLTWRVPSEVDWRHDVCVLSSASLLLASSRQNRSNYVSSVGKVLCVFASPLCDADVISHTFRSLSTLF